MRLWVWSTAAAFVAVALAGCADSGPASDDRDDFDDLDGDLRATDETGVIRGVVVDPAIVPVPGVKVNVVGQDLNATTNEKGAFGFSDLEPGAYFLEASKVGFNKTQTNVNVEAGVDQPPVVKILMDPNPTAAPFVQPLSLLGYLTCGVAVFATSVGCTTVPAVAGTIGDQSIFPHDYDRLPQWVQGELIWESTQTLSGAFIWEITPQPPGDDSNTHMGYRETTTSPALNYLDNVTIQNNADKILDRGISFRFFGGPHELCPGTGWPNTFGCGVTLEQSVEIFVHDFYNFQPQEGWRFTEDGPPEVPG